MNLSSKKLISGHKSSSIATTNAFAQKLAALAPWNITGPASHADWRDVPVQALEYRSASPTTSSVVKVPQASAQRVYNTRYFMRDTRRGRVSGDDLKKKATPNALDDAVAPTPARTKTSHGSVRTATVNSLMTGAARVNLFEDPNGGYS